MALDQKAETGFQLAFHAVGDALLEVDDATAARADEVMMTTFGAYDLTLFRVWTDEVPDHPSNAEMRELLSARPNAPNIGR